MALALTLITTAILIGYLFGKSVLDHKASVLEEEHRAFADSDGRVSTLRNLIIEGE